MYRLWTHLATAAVAPACTAVSWPLLARLQLRTSCESKDVHPQALEASAFAGGGSSAGVYRSKLAAAVRIVAAATALSALPDVAAAAAAAASAAAPAPTWPPAPPSPTVASAPAAAAPAAAASAEAMAGTPASAGDAAAGAGAALLTSLHEAALEQLAAGSAAAAAATLSSLADVHVTAALLAETGVRFAARCSAASRSYGWTSRKKPFI